MSREDPFAPRPLEVRDLDSLLEEVKEAAARATETARDNAEPGERVAVVQPEFTREEVENFVDYVVRGLSTLPAEAVSFFAWRATAQSVRSHTRLVFDDGWFFCTENPGFEHDSGSAPLSISDDYSVLEDAGVSEDDLVEAGWTHERNSRQWRYYLPDSPRRRTNPSGAVRTKRDEQLWAKAKARAAEAGHEGDWAYVMGVFKKSRRAGSRVRKNPTTIPLKSTTEQVGNTLRVGYIEAYAIKGGGFRGIFADLERQEAHKSDVLESLEEARNWAKRLCHERFVDRGYKLAAIRSKSPKLSYKANVWVSTATGTPIRSGLTSRKNPSIKLSEAQLSAVETYVTDPAHLDDTVEDDGAAATSRQIQAALKGNHLTLPTEPEVCWQWHARFAYASESAAESGDYAWAQSLNALASKCVSVLRGAK